MPDFTQQDLEKLIRIFSGQGRLHIGIANNLGGDPQSSLDFLRAMSPHLSQNMGGDDLGLLVTPEYFLRGSNDTSPSPIVNEYKHRLREISKDNPNIIYNIAGLYNKPITDPRKVEQRVNNFQNFLDEQEPRYSDVYNDNLSGYRKGLKDAWNRYQQNPQQNPLSTIKNQSNLHWKGDRIGSYNKSTFQDEFLPHYNEEINEDIYPPYVYAQGEWNPKRYGNNYGKELRKRKNDMEEEYSDNPNTGYENFKDIYSRSYYLKKISKLLCNNIHPELCLDTLHYGKNPQYKGVPKNIYTLQSNDVELPKQIRSPLAIYADKQALYDYGANAPNFNYNTTERHRNFDGGTYWPVIYNNQRVPLVQHWPLNQQQKPEHQFFKFQPITFQNNNL